MKIRINFKTDTIKESLDHLLPLFEGYNFDLNEIVWNHFDDLTGNFLVNEIKANKCSFDGDRGEYSFICEVPNDFDIDEYFEFPYNFTIEEIEEEED